MNVKYLLSVCFLLLFTVLYAEVRLPHIFGDNMVIQRDKPVKIQGWADKGEKITVSFSEQKQTTTADKKGIWAITLHPVAYGGPYELIVKGKNNSLTLKNVLVGDVWLCSGQSNMEMQVNGGLKVYDYEKEIKNADYPAIRHFKVAQKISEKPLDDVQGEWEVCSSQTVSDFTAVGYFFARKLYQELNIPIGLINSSWGGTDVETWTSEDTFNQLPQLYRDRYSGSKITDLEGFIKKNEASKAKFIEALKNDKGLSEKWYEPTYNSSGWKKMQIPALWEGVLGQDVDGIVWFRYVIKLPADIAGTTGTLSLGPVDDNDVTYVNGIKIGETNGYATDRIYEIPANILKSGDNVIVVKVTDTGGGGGIWGTPDKLNLKAGGKIFSLAGEWAYNLSVSNKESEWVNVSPNMYYSLLYNGMINPLIKYPIRGAIWYQGENNASQAYNYRTLFPTLINNWRSKWGYEFPFYWVQLANFMAKDAVPQESNWAELREAQTLTLSLPQTGEAVITDIGDEADIHPRNKQDVGLRLALNALNKTYGKYDVVYSGPTFKSMKIEGDRAVISYDNMGGGLVTPNKYGYIEGFAIAGTDRKFYWAKAYIDGDKVVVSSEKVKNPVAVRFCWSNNPDVNLFNREKLPAAPFRTE